MGLKDVWLIAHVLDVEATGLIYAEPTELTGRTS